MKTLIMLLFVATCFGVFSQCSNHVDPVSEGQPCDEGLLAFADTNAPVHSVVMDAKCNGPHWRAELVITNTGDKVITGYDIAYVEDYEHKKNVQSGEGQIP